MNTRVPITLIQIQAAVVQLIATVIDPILTTRIEDDLFVALVERWCDWSTSGMNPYPDWTMDVQTKGLDATLTLSAAPQSWAFEVNYHHHAMLPGERPWRLHSSQYVGPVPVPNGLLSAELPNIQYALINAKLLFD